MCGMRRWFRLAMHLATRIGYDGMPWGAMGMSYVFRVPDETYRALRLVAERQGRTPEDLFEEWVRAQSERVDAVPVTDTGASRLARFIGAFDAEEPDLIRRHDHYLAEAAAGTSDADD